MPQSTDSFPVQIKGDLLLDDGTVVGFSVDTDAITTWGAEHGAQDDATPLLRAFQAILALRER